MKRILWIALVLAALMALLCCGTVYIFAPAGGDTEASCEGIENCVFVAE